MKINKKLFKHGNSLALVVPNEFTKRINSQNVTIELTVDEANNPVLTITPSNNLDTLEADPNFALFIEAIYQNALAHPQKLKDSKDVWPEDTFDLIKGVNIEDE